MDHIEIKEVRNARFFDETGNLIDVEINHPQHGWIPYLITDYDADHSIDNERLISLIGNDIERFVPPTPEEVSANKAKVARIYRDRYLMESVDPIVSNPLRWSGMSPAQKEAVAAYRQALLDVPNQAGFPHDITWPTKPE